jgi:selenophosphate synthase
VNDEDPRRDLLFDPQTSGGLLISVAVDAVDQTGLLLEQAGIRPVFVGEVVPSTGNLLKIWQ